MAFFKLKKREKHYSAISNNNSTVKKYDVFLCKKSEDLEMAKEVCIFLEKNGISCFLSERDLPYIGQPNYYQTIDEALDNSKNMVVVCSNPNYMESDWVKHEWQSFSNELLSTKSKGCIITIISRDVERYMLPYTLRNLELIYWEEYQNKLLYYIKKSTRIVNDKSECPLPLKQKKSEAFSFGMNIVCHAFSFVSSFPKDDDMEKKIEKWGMYSINWTILKNPDDVAPFLEKIKTDFGNKWGDVYEDCLYLGMCFFLGSMSYDQGNGWGFWGRKLKVQCMKLNIPEQVFSVIDKKMSSDDILMFKDILMLSLDK